MKGTGMQGIKKKTKWEMKLHTKDAMSLVVFGFVVIIIKCRIKIIIHVLTGGGKKKGLPPRTPIFS